MYRSHERGLGRIDVRAICSNVVLQALRDPHARAFLEQQHAQEKVPRHALSCRPETRSPSRRKLMGRIFSGKASLVQPFNDSTARPPDDAGNRARGQ